MGHYLSEMRPLTNEEINKIKGNGYDLLIKKIKKILKNSTPDDNECLQMLVDLWENKETWKHLFYIINNENKK